MSGSCCFYFLYAFGLFRGRSQLSIVVVIRRHSLVIFIIHVQCVEHNIE